MFVKSERPDEIFSAVILAGGYGTRLGGDKAGTMVAGRPLLHWTAEAVTLASDDIVVVRRADQTLPPAGPGLQWREVVDLREGAGPLAGLEAALSQTKHELAVAVACDMPLVQAGLLRALAAACTGHDVVMPFLGGREQPLLAAYRRSCLPVIVAKLDEGEGRIRAILPHLRSRRWLPAEMVCFDPHLLSFTNVNYPRDVERVAELLSAHRTARE
ncbi:MAG: molybdenum cofactor guanylyltransferase [Dehalococcoidia bacterium]